MSQGTLPSVVDRKVALGACKPVQWPLVGCAVIFATCLVPWACSAAAVPHLVIQTVAIRTAAIQAVAPQADAQQALRSLPSNAWFDSQSGEYVPPKVMPAEDNPLRKTGWLYQEQSRAPAPASQPLSNWRGWNGLFTMGQWLPSLVLTLIAISLIIALGILTYYSLSNYKPNRFGRRKKSTAFAIDPSRATDLPFEVNAADFHPLAEAERLMRAGDYDTATRYLFGYLLLVLDQFRKLHLQKGKTNRMYVRELRQELQLRSIVEAAMLVFEASYFGRHAVTREQFLSVWQRMDEFHRLLQPVEVTTAAAQATRAATV